MKKEKKKCNTKIKLRICSIFLSSVVLLVSVFLPAQQIKAFALVDDALALWGTITAAAGGYAGYNMTKNQTSLISSDVADLYEEWWDGLTYVPWDKLEDSEGYVKTDDFRNWVLEHWSESCWDNRYWNLFVDNFLIGIKKYDGVKCKTVDLKKEVARELKLDDDFNKKSNGEDPKPDPKIPDLLAELFEDKIQMTSELVSKVSKTVKLIIDTKYNADYIKSQSKYDWAALGFKDDYETFPRSTLDTNVIKTIRGTDDFTNDYINNHTLIQYDINSSKYGNRTYLALPDCKNSSGAFITFHNYKTNKWNLAYMPESLLFEKFSLYKNNAISYDELVTDLVSTNLPGDNLMSYYFGIKSDGSCISVCEFLGDSITSDSPFPLLVSDCADFNPQMISLNLSSVNSKFINLGKSANYYFINFVNDEKTYTATCSALNGTIQPYIAFSQYSNTKNEIENAGNITVDIDLSQLMNNTDLMIKQIGIDNDLNLKLIDIETDQTDTNKHIKDNTDTIIDILYDLPNKIYIKFKPALTKIINLLKVPAVVTSSDKDAINNMNSNMIEEFNIVIRAIANPSTQWLNTIDDLRKYLENDLLFIHQDLLRLYSKLDYEGNRFYEKLDNLDFGSGTTFTDMSTNIKNMPTEISNKIEEGAKKLVIPEKNYFNNIQVEFDTEFNNKMSYSSFVNSVTSWKDVKETKFENIDMTYKDSKVTLINFDYYYDNKELIYPYIEGIFYFLLIAFNIHHIYLLIRGKSIDKGGD